MESKISFCIPLAILTAGISISCGTMEEFVIPGAGFSFDDAPPPRFGPVSVHDPSVFPADDVFYVIGSHLAMAKTGDFIQWNQVSSDWNGRPNILYPADNPDPSVQTMKEQIADVMRGQRNPLGFFASDIHLMPDGKFYHYYSITASWYCSAIGLAVGDSAEGPYVTQGLIVRSGEAADDSKTPDGTSAWIQIRFPNCIDPQAFFDNDGKFWLVYGSWSGGIFLLELDPSTGMLKEGAAINAESNGYGRRLIRNAHGAVEGPYIIYSPQSGYYYLFVSFGGLAAAGGYNMRVFRSTSPDGPYEDTVNHDIGKEFRHTSLKDYGVKIMGGYQFSRLGGPPGLGNVGYLSPGHNSVWYDADTGRYFLIYHQRFSGRGEYHEVRVRELFVTEDNWFAASPFRYDGGRVRSFIPDQLTGDWRLINHGRDNNTTPHESRIYQFRGDGKITEDSGKDVGIWELGDDGKTANITVDGILYKGVFLRCWDDEDNSWVQAFTALSGEGVALWGAGAAPK
ncbi:MAG: glycoside hydrolase family 43 protein [Treponema sp.]|nr:glycoside hydrolase family 43 protein [Treponema sp.]